MPCYLQYRIKQWTRSLVTAFDMCGYSAIFYFTRHHFVGRWRSLSNGLRWKTTKPTFFYVAYVCIYTCRFLTDFENEESPRFVEFFSDYLMSDEKLDWFGKLVFCLKDLIKQKYFKFSGRLISVTRSHIFVQIILFWEFMKMVKNSLVRSLDDIQWAKEDH